jgi:regulator of replication initiation timing
MNLKAISERLNEALGLVNSSFADEVTEETTETVEATETTESVATEFAEVTLMDGETVLSYDGELAEGTAIFVVAEGEQVQAPEGTYELGGDMAGVSIVVNADGMISEVIDAREETEEVEESPEAEAMSSEEVEAKIDEKMSAISEPLNAIVNGIESILSDNDSLRKEVTELKSELEEFKKSPSIEQQENNKFSSTDKISRRQQYLQNFRKNS